MNPSVGENAKTKYLSKYKLKINFIELIHYIETIQMK